MPLGLTQLFAAEEQIPCLLLVVVVGSGMRQHGRDITLPGQAVCTQICGKLWVLLDKRKGYSSFSRGRDSGWFLHGVGEVQPLGTERSQYLSHHGLLGKVLCYPTAPPLALRFPSLPQSTDLISIIMNNLAQLVSLQITPSLRAGLQRCLVLPTATVHISKAAPSPRSPLPGRQEKQAGRDDLGGENTTLGSGHQ